MPSAVATAAQSAGRATAGCGTLLLCPALLSLVQRQQQLRTLVSSGQQVCHLALKPVCTLCLHRVATSTEEDCAHLLRRDLSRTEGCRQLLDCSTYIRLPEPLACATPICLLRSARVEKAPCSA